MAPPAAAAARLRRRRHAFEICAVDRPRAVDLPGRQDPEPDATVDRHVVDAEKIGRLVQADATGIVGRNQRASVRASICDASTELATTVSVKSALLWSADDLRRPSRRYSSRMLIARITGKPV